LSTTVRPQSAEQSPDATEIVRVSVPQRSWRSELRAIRIVWRRELIRFRADKLRMLTSLVQPLLFLFVLGAGLQQLSRAGTHGVSLKTFIYPGILCITVMFTAMFSAASIVWDREFGFLREMMVAPIRRSSIVIGKCLGGATVAGLQGVIVICLAGLVSVPYDPLLILGVFGLQLLLAFSITAFGVMIAVRIKQMQSFMGVMQMIVMPLADRAQPPGPPDLRRGSHAASGLQPPVDLPRRPPGARSGRHLVGLARPVAGRSGHDRGPRAGHAVDRHLGVQHHRVTPVRVAGVAPSRCRRRSREPWRPRPAAAANCSRQPVPRRRSSGSRRGMRPALTSPSGSRRRQRAPYGGCGYLAARRT